MYIECRDYLVEIIKAAGIKREVHINQKTLDVDNEPHKAAIIAESDEQKRSGQKVSYIDQEGKKHKRTKQFDRTLTFIVTIGDYTYAQVETIFESFLRLIEAGIYIDGNYTEISLLPATWYDEEDKIIKSKAAVVFKVQFAGGLYKDTGYKKIAVDFEDPEMDGKEE